MKEKCSKCYEWKERKEFLPLPSGSTKPRCIACVEKAKEVSDLRKEMDRHTAQLSVLNEKLKKKLGTYDIPQPVTPTRKVFKPTTVVLSGVSMHKTIPLGMKKNDIDVYFIKSNGNGLAKCKVWDGPHGPYTSYYNKKEGKYTYISLSKLRNEIFRK
jgi:hypothetical protein